MILNISSYVKINQIFTYENMCIHLNNRSSKDSKDLIEPGNQYNIALHVGWWSCWK